MKVLLADDHAITRDGLRAILEKQADLRIVGEAGERARRARARDRARTRRGGDGREHARSRRSRATRKLVARVPGAKVIALSMHADRRYVEAMLAAGASAYVVKNGAASELLAAIDAVAAGGTYVSAEVPGEAGVRAPRAIVARELTAREREVLQLLAEGRSSKEIGVRLGIALPTVETHRRQIMTKLAIHSIAQLTKYAVREGLTLLEK